MRLQLLYSLFFLHLTSSHFIFPFSIFQVVELPYTHPHLFESLNISPPKVSTIYLRTCIAFSVRRHRSRVLLGWGLLFRLYIALGMYANLLLLTLVYTSDWPYAPITTHWMFYSTSLPSFLLSSRPRSPSPPTASNNFSPPIPLIPPNTPQLNSTKLIFSHPSPLSPLHYLSPPKGHSTVRSAWLLEDSHGKSSSNRERVELPGRWIKVAILC